MPLFPDGTQALKLFFEMHLYLLMAEVVSQC